MKNGQIETENSTNELVKLKFSLFVQLILKNHGPIQFWNTSRYLLWLNTKIGIYTWASINAYVKVVQNSVAQNGLIVQEHV